MKVRIQDSSIRFRVTLQELEVLVAEGRLERTCGAPGMTAFRYGVHRDATLAASRMQVEPYRLELALCPADLQRLAAPEEEGVYVEEEWTDEGGARRRFLAFVEKDRPGSTCVKREAWIYRGHDGREPVTVPIGGGGGQP